MLPMPQKLQTVNFSSNSKNCQFEELKVMFLNFFLKIVVYKVPVWHSFSDTAWDNNFKNLK